MKIFFLLERKQKGEAFLEQNCSVTGKKTEVLSVFRTKLVCYGKENRSLKRFWNKIVFLWVRKEKCEAFFEENCCYKKENRSANRFRNKIVLFWGREETWEAFLEQNCSVIG